MNISAPCIRRPVATTLLMFGVMVFGVTAYRFLPVSSLPNVDFPTITVTGNFPGASPETMASAVATPLEQQFSSVPGVAEMTSLSGVGTTTITLQFDLSTDINSAAQDVQTAINAASGLLPKDLPSPPTYRKVNPNNFPVLIYAVHSDLLPGYVVDRYVTNVLAQPLSMVPGVGGVFIFGQKKYAVRVEIDPMALAARHIGLEQVRAALANATINLPKGEIIGPQSAVTLDANDQLIEAAPYRNIVIAYRNGAPVHLSDVAKIVNSEENTQVGAWYDNIPAEGLAIERADGSNALAVIRAVKALMPRLQRSLPPSIKVELMSDRSELTRAAITDVQYTMLLTIALVIFVIFVFLRALSATLIPSLVVPLSLLATFAVMYVAGYTLDNISLMGLTIAVGFLIDDAIVMIENIVRHIEAGEKPLQAALNGAGQIGFTIISITFSLIAVFIPIFFMGGIVGRLFHEFAATVSIAVLASAFFSLTLTPVLCSLFLKSAHEQHKSRLNRVAERGFEAVLRAYDRGLGFVFRHQRATLVSTLLLAVATVYLYAAIPKGFVPEQDTGLFFGLVETRQDSSFNHTVHAARQILNVIDHDRDVAGVFLHAGAYSYNPGENTGHIFGQLKPYDERDRAQTILQRIENKVKSVVGAELFMQIPQAIRVGGRLARTEYQYTLTDTNIDELDRWAPIMEAAMKKLPQLQQVASDQQIAAPHIEVVVDRQKAEQFGLSAALIDQTLYDAFGQRQVATIYGATDQNKVVLELAPRFSQDPTVLQRLFVTTPGGAEVPLSGVANYVTRLEPLTISHQGVFPAVTLSFNLGPWRCARPGRRCDQERRRHARRATDFERFFRGHRAGVPDFVGLDAAVAGGGNPRCLYRPRHALRELHPSDHDPLGPAGGRGWRTDHVVGLPLRSFGDCDHRHRFVDRYCQEERNYDDRLRAVGAARRRQEAAGSDPRGLPVAFPADHDDDVLGAVRLTADRVGSGRRVRAAAADGDRFHWRHFGVAMADALHNAGRLSLPRTIVALAGPLLPAIPYGRGDG